MKNLRRSPFFYLSLILAFAVAFEIASVVSAAWTAPTQSPPNGSPAQPIDTSGDAQTKTGGLTITSNAPATNGVKIDPYGHVWFGSSNGDGTIKTSQGGIYFDGTQLQYTNNGGTSWQPIGSGSGSAFWATTTPSSIYGGIYYTGGAVGIGSQPESEFTIYPSYATWPFNFGSGGGANIIRSNAYWSGSLGTDVYATSGPAEEIVFEGDGIHFVTAPSGVAGKPVAQNGVWADRMSFDSMGNLTLDNSINLVTKSITGFWLVASDMPTYGDPSERYYGPATDLGCDTNQGDTVTWNSDNSATSDCNIGAPYTDTSGQEQRMVTNPGTTGSTDGYYYDEYQDQGNIVANYFQYKTITVIDSSSAPARPNTATLNVADINLNGGLFDGAVVLPNGTKICAADVNTTGSTDNAACAKVDNGTIDMWVKGSSQNSTCNNSYYCGAGRNPSGTGDWQTSCTVGYPLIGWVEDSGNSNTMSSGIVPKLSLICSMENTNDNPEMRYVICPLAGATGHGIAGTPMINAGGPTPFVTRNTGSGFCEPSAYGSAF